MTSNNNKMLSAIQESFSQSTHDTMKTFKERPVECILILILTICNTFARDAFDGLLYQSTWLVIPIMFLAAFIANALLPQDNNWRKLYEFILPLAIIGLIGGTDEKFAELRSTTEYYTIISLLFAGCLIVKHFKNDLEFIINMTSIGWAALRSLVISLAAWMAFSILVLSIENIFEITIESHLLSIPWTLVFPILLLSFYDHTPQVSTIESPFANGLLNFVVTIAIIGFTVILYAYIIKILVTWNLPHGGIARMTYLFFIASITTSSLYRLTMMNVFNSFYHWLPILSLPIIVLYWVAVIRRIYDFGFTEPRVYMVMAGIINLVFMFMVFFDRKIAYKSTITYAMGFAFVLGLIPPISAQNIASNLQWTNAVSTVVSENIAVAEDLPVSSFKFIENDNQPIDIHGFKTAIFPKATISGDSLILENDDKIILITGYEDMIRRIAHRNDMTYDDFLGLAYTGYGTATLNVEMDSVYISFKKIIFNDYEKKAVVGAAFLK